MKTIVKTDYTGQMLVQPLRMQEMVMLTSRDAQGQTVYMEMTPDQCTQLIECLFLAMNAIGATV